MPGYYEIKEKDSSKGINVIL